MKTFAFVFARGGSKGLVGKNMMPLGGTPLIGHAIQSAQQVSRVSEVFVSTDSAEIADVAQGFGANVIQRPPELASDTASEWLAWQHATSWVQARKGDFQVFLSLPATSPLRSVADIDACLDMLQDGGDMVVTVTPASRNPWFNMVTRKDNGASQLVMQELTPHRRQDAPEVFDMTTVAYVTRPGYILEQNGIFAGEVRSVVIPKERAVDIDDATDFMLAKALYEVSYD